LGLKAMREKRGLTQRKLAHDPGISQNYIPRSRQAPPRLSFIVFPAWAAARTALLHADGHGAPPSHKA
jgi:transcriptional regulator with XRE-family HTH domain